MTDNTSEFSAGPSAGSSADGFPTAPVDTPEQVAVESAAPPAPEPVPPFDPAVAPAAPLDAPDQAVPEPVAPLDPAMEFVAPLDPAERAVELFDAETRDITPGGLCLVAPWRPKPGQTCKVELPGDAATTNPAGVRSSITTLHCQVRYSVREDDGNYRTGLTFLAAA